MGIGYLLSFAIIIVDLLLSAYGGWLLAAVSFIAILIINGWVNRKKLNTYKCDDRTNNKFQQCVTRIQNKTNRKIPFFTSINFLVIPGNDVDSCLVDWKTIGITEGALTIEPRVLEAIIAHELGHMMNGDELLNTISVVNFFGLFFVLLLNHFVFIAVVYLVLLLIFILGVVKINFFSAFVGTRLAVFLHRMGKTILSGVLTCFQSVTRYLKRFGDYVADGYAVDFGYGLYLKRFLEAYLGTSPRRGILSPLYHYVKDINKRVIKIESRIRKQRNA